MGTRPLRPAPLLLLAGRAPVQRALANSVYNIGFGPFIEWWRPGLAYIIQTNKGFKIPHVNTNLILKAMFLKTLPLCTFNFLPRSSKWLQNYKNIMFLWAVKATNKIFTSYFLSKKSELFLKIISILLPLLFDTAGLCLRNYSICWCNHWDHSGHNNFLSVSSLNDEIFPFPGCSKHSLHVSL